MKLEKAGTKWNMLYGKAEGGKSLSSCGDRGSVPLDFQVIDLMNLLCLLWLNTCPLLAPHGARIISFSCSPPPLNSLWPCLTEKWFLHCLSSLWRNSLFRIKHKVLLMMDLVTIVCVFVLLCRLGCGTLKRDCPWRECLYPSM